MSTQTLPPDTVDLPPLPTSHADFERLAATYPALRMELSADGKATLMAPTGGGSDYRNANIIAQLVIWSEQNGTGIAFGATAGFVLPSGAILSPDAAWLERERWNALSEAQQERFLPLCPAFVMELMSPADSLPETQAKMRQFIAEGARLGWLLVPRLKRVEVYRPSMPLKALADPDTLSGDDTLPGFTLNLRRVWG